MRFRDADALGFIPSRRRCGDSHTEHNPEGRKIEVEDSTEPTAIFSAGHSARQHDDDDSPVTIHSPGGNAKVCTFHTPHTAQTASDGTLHLFPTKPKAATKDLAALNQFHARHYKQQP
jgi:hypothetical protein